MPPQALPLEHFAAGALWLAIGAASLVAVAPDLARGAWLTPGAVAVTHAFTLGLVTTSIFGALYQIYPVALGVGARSVRVAHLTFWTLQAGTVLMVLGARAWRPPLMAAGWVVLFLAVGGFSWNLLPARRRATRGRRIGAYVSAGHMGLGLAMLVILANLGVFLGWWSAPRQGVLSAHVHLALVGFATLTAVGVGSKLLPMFLMTRGAPEWPLRAIGPLVFVGVVVLAAGEIARWGPLRLAGGTATVAGLVLYLALAATWFAKGTRRPPGAALLQIGAAHASLAAATVVGAGLLLGVWGGDVVLALYGVLGILGWLALLVTGVYGRVVPVLTWMGRFADRAGEPGIPRMGEMTLPWLAGLTSLLCAGGVAVLAVGIALEAAGVARTGAVAFAAGAAGVLVQGGRMARVGRDASTTPRNEG